MVMASSRFVRCCSPLASISMMIGAAYGAIVLGVGFTVLGIVVTGLSYILLGMITPTVVHPPTAWIGHAIQAVVCVLHPALRGNVYASSQLLLIVRQRIDHRSKFGWQRPLILQQVPQLMP